MLDQEQAKLRAEQVLLEERRAAAEQHWWAARVPVMLRCDELKLLEPHERADVVKRAQQLAERQYALSYVTVVLLIAVGGALLLLATGGPQFDRWLAAYVVAVIVPFVGYARLVVMPYVRKQAIALGQTKTQL